MPPSCAAPQRIGPTLMTPPAGRPSTRLPPPAHPTGPRDVFVSRAGCRAGCASGRIDRAWPVVLPPAVPFGIPACYIKPYLCCGPIQPAVEALIGLCRAENISPDEVTRVDVDTYRIA